MITPTVGRIVWHHENELGGSPLAAIIVFVHSETMVNLVVFDTYGTPHSRTSIPLVQPGNEAPSGFFCEWMPYQVKKATGSESGEQQAGTQEI